LALREELSTLEDSVGERVEGTQRLVPSGTVRAGRWVPPKATER
jgi:hypothetical protein